MSKNSKRSADKLCEDLCRQQEIIAMKIPKTTLPYVVFLHCIKLNPALNIFCILRQNLHRSSVNFFFTKKSKTSFLIPF
jgi:hypothetical protein